jgi:glutamine synthetase
MEKNSTHSTRLTAGAIKNVFALIKKHDVKMIDFRFTDLPGQWQHFSVPVNTLDEKSFTEGIGFDGSSIRGWQAIHESDMLIFPDPTTAVIDPFIKMKSLSLICDIKDPITKESYSRDPRHIAKKAIEYLRSVKLAENAYFGPEAEFFILDHVAYNTNEFESWYRIDSQEAFWNTGSEHEMNLGHKIRNKEGYFPVPPADSTNDCRNMMVEYMLQAGIEVETQHHEVSTGGQAEIDMKFADLVHMADNLQMFKYIVKNTARQFGKTATFMPKPVFGDNGSGMHVHQSLWNNGKPLFAGKEYAGLSQQALYYAGGLLKHAPALLAFTNPTTNSYKRLVPGYEAPINLAYSKRNRSAAVRIPMYSENPKTKRLEFRCPDGTANPYLAFAAMLMAGIDGIKNKIEPGEPLDVDIYHLSDKEASKVPQAPGSLDSALEELKKDQEFLKRGGVFTDDLIETWIEYKIEKEIKPMQLRPHPYEFYLYYEV